MIEIFGSSGLAGPPSLVSVLPWRGGGMVAVIDVSQGGREDERKAQYNMKGGGWR